MERNTANIENCFSRQQRHPLQQIEQLCSASMQSDPTRKAWQQRVIPSQPKTFSNVRGFVPAHHVPPVSGHQRQSTTACSNSLLIPWPESTQVTVTAGSASDQERAGLQTVQHQPCHGNRSTQTAISNLTDASNNSHGAINSPGQVLDHQDRTLISSSGGWSSTPGQHSVGDQATMAVEVNPKSSTISRQQCLSNPFHPLIMTGAPPVGAVSGEPQACQNVELANSQTVYEAPWLETGPPLYQSAMLPPIKRLVASSQLPHRPGSEQYDMTFDAGLNQRAPSKNLSGSPALQIPSGSHFAAFENHKINVFGFQEATWMPLRSGPVEFGMHLYGNESSNILEAWHEQDDEPGLLMTGTPPVGAVSGGPRECQFVEMARSQTVPQPPIQGPGSIAVWVPLEAATAPHKSIGIVKFGNTQQRVGTPLTPRKGEIPDEIRNFARTFKEWRLSLGLDRAKVSRLLKGANGETYSATSILRFENSGLCLEYTRKIELALQDFMASYKPVPVETSLTPRMGDCETPDGIRNFARAFKEWRLSLGLSQTKVSRLLKGANGETYSESSILRFESSALSPKFANEIKLALKEFMASYKPVPDSCSKRRKRTRFSPEASELLEQFFQMNRHPTPREVTNLAEDLTLNEEIIRTWFRNRRQSARTNKSRWMGPR